MEEFSIGLTTTGNIRPVITTSRESKDGDAADAKAGGRTIVVVPSLDAQSPFERTSVEPRRAICVEAIVTLPTGQRYSFQTTSVSVRGLFVSASTRDVPLQLHTLYGIELRWVDGAVNFRAELVHLAEAHSSNETSNWARHRGPTSKSSAPRGC